MKLTWLETASLRIETDQTAIAVDPFLCEPYHRPAEKVKAYLQAEAVLVTHGHFDHIHHLTRIYRDAEIPVYCTKTPAETLKRDGFDACLLHVISPGDTIKIGNLEITVYQSRHCRFDQPLIRRKIRQLLAAGQMNKAVDFLRLSRLYPENKETLFFEIKDHDTCLCLMGSLGLDPYTEYPTQMDGLVLPFQGRSDLDEQAASIVQKLQPKRIFLDHYDDAFAPISEAVDTSNFVEMMKEDCNIECKAMEPFADEYL